MKTELYAEGLTQQQAPIRNVICEKGLQTAQLEHDLQNISCANWIGSKTDQERHK